MVFWGIWFDQAIFDTSRTYGVSATPNQSLFERVRISLPARGDGHRYAVIRSLTGEQRKFKPEPRNDAIDPERHFATANCRIAKGSFDHLVADREQSQTTLQCRVMAPSALRTTRALSGAPGRSETFVNHRYLYALHSDTPSIPLAHGGAELLFVLSSMMLSP
jgi:hypothetical protein